MQVCKEIVFKGHAVLRMSQRGISKDEVVNVMLHGEVIQEYPEDKPYPSKLQFKMINDRPLHVVSAKDEIAGICYVITVYIADVNEWEQDFKTRKKR
jgi:hypothetical protein